MTDELIAAMLAVAPDAAALDRLAELAEEEEEDDEDEDEEEEVGESTSARHHPAVLAAMLRAAESEDWAAVDRLAAMTPGEVRAVIEGGTHAESYTAREYVGLLREYRAGLVLKAVGTGKSGKPVKRWVRAEPLPARDPNKPKRDVVADAKAAKAGREPGRQAAREAWRKAVSGGGGDPAELAAHLRLLTRDELREMNRDLANQLGGVKEDHVTRLLTHAGAVGPQQSPPTGVDKPPTVGNTTPVPPQSAGANTGGGVMQAATAGDVMSRLKSAADLDGVKEPYAAGVGTAQAATLRVPADASGQTRGSRTALSDGMRGGVMPSVIADELVAAGYSRNAVAVAVKRVADGLMTPGDWYTAERAERNKADAAAWLAKGGAA